MKDLTVIILTRDDEDVISDAIKSVKEFAGEVIVIDANSIDGTAKIAEKLGALVIKHPFKDFSDQRNFGILHAKTDWVLYLDSDERITPEFADEVEKVVKNFAVDNGIGGFFINRKTYYFGKDWNFQDKVQRLFFREKFIEWVGVVHETPKIRGSFGQISNPILHFTHRNLSQMLGKTNKWSEYESRLRFDANHPPMEVWRFIRVMTTEFITSYIKNKGYKNGTYGLIEAMYQSFSIFITYSKLWELQQKSVKRS